MQRKSLVRVLFILFFASLLLPPIQWSTTAAPSRPLAQHLAHVQPPPEAQSPSILQPASTATESVLYPSDDAPVQEGTPSSADPGNLYLGAGYYQGFPYGANGRVRSYMRFDLSGIPSGSTIVSATLRLYQAGGADYPGHTRDVTLSRVTGSWSESSITWNNRPSYADTLGSFTTTYNFFGWLTLDLSDQVRSWVGGSQDNYGLVAIGPESTQGVYRVFGSGESDHSPELLVRYLPPLPPVLDAWPGTLSVQASSATPTAASSFQVSNVTYGSLDWTASKVGSATWLTLNDTSGSVTPTAPNDLGLTVNASSLTPGAYSEQIRISSSTPDVEGNPITVTVSLEVLEHLSTVYLPLVIGSSSSSPEIVALIIGIGDYQHLGPPLGSGTLPDTWGFDLPNPPRDRDDFSKLLLNDLGVSSNGILQCCGGPEETVSAMSGQGGPDVIQDCALATRSNVVTAFGQLDDMEGKDTTVIFYYSGHGGQTPDDEGDESDGADEFIAMYDTYTDTVGFVNVLTDDDLDGLLGNLESEHIVVILDSCYSGSMVDATAVQMSGDLQQRGLTNHTIMPNANAGQESQAILDELAAPGRMIITAGTGDQGTWESNALQNGVFTYFFLQGLRDDLNDANQDDRISAEEAYWFTKDLVDDWVFTSQGVHQNPAIADHYFGQMNLIWLP